MSFSNTVAERAYRVVTYIIRTGVPRVRTDIFDVLAAEQARPSSNYSTTATNVSIQSAITFEEKQPENVSWEFSSISTMLDRALQMPSTFGTPFIMGLINMIC
jgi:hypothetical protein